MASYRSAIRAAESAAAKDEERTCRLQFLLTAKYVAAEDCVAQYAAALALEREDGGTEKRGAEYYLDDLMAAAARAERWPALLDLIRSDPWFADINPWALLRHVGAVWADRSRTEKRAQLYAAISQSLPVIAEIISVVGAASSRIPSRCSSLVSAPLCQGPEGMGPRRMARPRPVWGRVGEGGSSRLGSGLRFIPPGPHPLRPT